MTDEIPIVRKLYEIKSILKTDPPPGAEGKNWYRYEIAHGTNSISGYKQGTLDEVTEAMEENVVQLNERQFGKKAMASKKKAEKKPEDKKEEKSEDSAEKK
jgi:hypothetical protein